MNRPVIRKLFLCVVFIQCVAFTTSTAIIIRHDREDIRYLELGQGFPSLCHLNLPDGQGTLIAPQWILTAAHVARDLKWGHRVTIGNKEFEIRSVLIHPEWRTSRHDIALVKLNKPVSHVKPTPLYKKQNETGRIITIVGKGDFGTGLTGPTNNDGMVRGARNKIDEVNNAWIIFKFDEPNEALDLEGISGPGDSGGPAYIEEDGKWYVAGVSAIQSFAKLGLREGRYGVLEYYSRVSVYSEWIEKSIQAH